jgi:hypothetical protein
MCYSVLQGRHPCDIFTLSRQSDSKAQAEWQSKASYKGKLRCANAPSFDCATSHKPSHEGLVTTTRRYQLERHHCMTITSIKRIMQGPGRPTAGLVPVCCFEYTFSAHATIRQLVLGHLTKEEADALRQVSRGVRTAVNDTVVTVVIEPNAPRSDTDLAQVFPEANMLRVMMQRRSALADLLHYDVQQLVTEEDSACTLLEHISATSPALLTKLQALTLTLGTIPSVNQIAAAVAGFLSRCDHARVACCADSSDRSNPTVAV